MCPEVWMWVHRKYKMSWIKRKLYSFKWDNCTYLDIHDDDGTNQLNYVTYDPQCINDKTLMTWNIAIKVLQLHLKH